MDEQQITKQPHTTHQQALSSTFPEWSLCTLRLAIRYQPGRGYQSFTETLVCGDGQQILAVACDEESNGGPFPINRPRQTFILSDLAVIRGLALLH